MKFLISLLLFGFIYSDILRPQDNFDAIDYEADMGICIGVSGNSSNLTDYEKFEAFKKHNCLPVIVLEGVEGTKLQLRITDCNALSDNILNNCNIMTEKNKQRFIWHKPLDLVKCQSNVSEFLVWLAFDGDPVGAIGGGDCMNAIFGSQLDQLKSYYNQPPPYILPDQAGIIITWYGNTPNTLNASQCGVASGEDLGSSDLPIAVLMDWQAFYDYTIGMGYQPGLTLLPIPYDWRRMAGNYEVTTSLKRSIEYAYSITGKRVVIAAHSFGCLAFLSFMNSLPQAFKDQYIDSFFGLSCAWGGSTSATGDVIKGEDFGVWQLGYPMNDLRTILTSITSLFDLQPKGIFNINSGWGKAINQRAEIEATWDSANPPSNVPFPWFPTPESDCYSRSTDHLCGLHLYNFFKNPFVYTPEATYMLNDSSVQSILEQYMLRSEDELAFIKQIDAGDVTQQQQQETWGTKQLIPKDRVALMMEMVQRNGVQNLINPGYQYIYVKFNKGVQIHHIYGGHYETKTWYNISSNPRNETNKGESPGDDVMTLNSHWGDHTVNIDNAIVPSLKWAWDFENGVSNAKPVHMIDYCSNNSQLMYKDQTGKYTTNYKPITQNTYNGILCDNLEHDEFPNDQFNIKYASALFQSGQNKFLNYLFQLGAPGTANLTLSESDVNMIVQTCPHITAPWTDQTAEALYIYGINTTNLQQNKNQYDYPFSQPTNEFIQFLENYYNSLQTAYQENLMMNQ